MRRRVDGTKTSPRVILIVREWLRVERILNAFGTKGLRDTVKCEELAQDQDPAHSSSRDRT